MNYAICRVSKLKSPSKLRSVGNHNTRRMDVPNADPDRAHGRIFGDDKNLDTLVQERFDSLDVSTRKDSVLAMEIMLSASPEHFRPGNPLKWGSFDKDKVKKWADESRTFLKEKYGANLIAIDLHLDERTPHIHAVVTPIEKKQRKKRGKDEYYEKNVLVAKTMFGKYQLKQLQTDYAKAMKPLGLSRGVSKSKTRHQTLKRYYGRVENILQKAKRLVFSEKKNSQEALESLQSDYLTVKEELAAEKLKTSLAAREARLEGKNEIDQLKNQLSEEVRQKEGLYRILKGRNPRAAHEFDLNGLDR